MISISQKGDFSKTRNFLKNAKVSRLMAKLDHLAHKGVQALAAATPKDTGLTAALWNYEIHYYGDKVEVVWTNGSFTKSGIPIVILLQYGHATRNGGYVQGRDFINPAIKPVFDEIANDVWKEVQKL